MIPVAIVLVVFAVMAKDPPSKAKPATLGDFGAVLAQVDAWRFCLLYFVTFGGFVGLSYFMNKFFVDQYDFPKATVGLSTALFIVSGSLLRPIGGALADKLGGIRMLTVLYADACVMALGIGFLITNMWATFALLFVLMGCLGMGNGSVFQMVPQRFKKEIGVMTGLVGAAGGVGGYYLNLNMGNLHDQFGTYASGFFAFAMIAAVGLWLLRQAAPGWQRSWLGEGGVAHTPEKAARARSGDAGRQRDGDGAGVGMEPALERKRANTRFAPTPRRARRGANLVFALFSIARQGDAFIKEQTMYSKPKLMQGVYPV